MGWKQCVISINDRYELFENGIRLLARAHGDPPDLALFTRTTADRRRRVLLLSPLAAQLAGDDLCPLWTDSDAPELFTWDCVFGSPDARERLGLQRSGFQRSPLRSPPVECATRHA